MRKLRFFDVYDLLKPVWAVTLSTLMVCGIVRTRADEVGPGSGSDSGVTVKIRPMDAQRLRDTNRLREELANAAEAVKRLELECETLREEKAALRGELFEVREKMEKQNEAYQALRLWLAGVPAEGTVRKTDGREDQLLKALGYVSESGSGLALKSVAFCDLVRQLLRELSIGKVRQAEIQLKLDDLTKDARRFIALTEGEEAVETGTEPLRTCRVLAVDRNLSGAVLSVGSAKGAFVGMVYRVGKDNRTQLKVVSVRPFVAAAVVIAGSIDDLAPGMEAVAGEKAESTVIEAGGLRNKN